MSSVSKWEWLTFKIRGLTIDTSKKMSKLRKQKQLSIINNINSLCGKTDLSSEEFIELTELQGELDNSYLDKAKGAFIRSRARWVEEGGKNTT